MSLYLKVPPNKGPCVAVFLFEDIRLLDNNIVEYKDIILYSDLKLQSWVQLPTIKKKLNTLRSSIVNQNINIVVCNKGYHKNEILFVAYLDDDKTSIPLIDQMICTFYKITSRRLTYRQRKVSHSASDEAMRSLLEGQILTKQERRLLGIENGHTRNKTLRK